MGGINMVKEYNYIFSPEETLKYYNMHLLEPVLVTLPFKIKPIKVPLENGVVAEFTCERCELSLTPIAVSTPVDGFELDESHYCQYVNSKANYIFEGPNRIFNPITIADYNNGDKYPIDIMYNRKSDEYHHIRDGHDSYFIIYTITECSTSNPYMSDILDYIKQYPKNTLFIQEVGYVSRYTIILDTKERSRWN